MTRINLVPVESLADQHLLAEWRELPRMAAFAAKSTKSLADIPGKYLLGPGHMTFFLNKGTFLEARHSALVTELLKRGFNLMNMPRFVMNPRYGDLYTWAPTAGEIALSQARIVEKLNAKPDFYKWTRHVA